MPRGKSKVEELRDAPVSESPEEQVEEEPFSELRYKAPPPVEPGPEYHPKLVRVAVTKTKKFWRLSEIRSSSGRPNDSKDTMTISSLIASTASTKSPRSCLQGYLRDKDCMNEHASLSASAIQPPRLTMCSNPVQEMIAPRLSTYIRNPRHCSELFHAELSASTKREAKCLERHKKAKQAQLRQENEMIKKSGKDRDNLVLRRNQVMPKISSRGLEKTIIPVQRAETPKKFPDWVLWAPIIYDIKEKNGISPQRQKYQQGYDVVTDWVGHPEITDELRKELGLNEEHAMSTIVQNASEEVCTEQIDCRCVPKMERLGVLGIDYNRIQHVLRQPIRKLVVLDKENQATGGLNSFSSLSTCGNQETFDPSKRQSSSVSLVLGNVNLNWSTDPQNSNKTRVVELGCSAEPNKHSIDYVLMRNTGTTVIRFNWVKKNEGDGFHKNRMGQMRMIFDYYGGIILPGEVYRIPFMYKALTPGQFCEDWKLLTQPVLENGAEIILRLWGFTRLSDKQLSTRERIEDKLRQRRVTTIAKNILDKIIKNLPIGESSFDEASLPYPQLNGPDLFIFNNPWLYYNSYHVDRLRRIDALVMNELRKQQKSVASMTLVDRDEESSLSSYHDGGVDDRSPESSGSTAINEAIPMSQTEIGKDSSSEEESDSESIGLYESLSEELMILRKELIESAPKMIVAKSNVSQKKDKSKPPSTEELVSENSGVSTKDTSSTQESLRKDRSITSLSKQVQSSIDMVKPNIVVHSTRQALLQMKTNYIRQDALFTVMTEEINSLLFKPFYPCDNWKIPVLKGLFSKAIEEFGMFASQLETSCYEAEHMAQDHKELEADHRGSAPSYEFSDNSSADDTMTANEQQQQVFAEEANTSGLEEASVLDEEVESGLPRFDLEPERYRDHYYGRLYSTMYWLLSNMIDEMDTLIYKPPRVDPRYGKAVFIKIDKVPLNVDIKSELEKPLPPKWVNILHKMNTIRRQFFTSDTKIAPSDPDSSGVQE